MDSGPRSSHVASGFDSRLGSDAVRMESRREGGVGGRGKKQGGTEASGRCQDIHMTKQPVTGSLTLPTES